MTENNDKKASIGSGEYDRVLSRLVERLESAEIKSWDLLQEQVREAVEIELAAEDMTKDELNLLSQYVARDLKKLGYYAHETGEGIAAWLHFDLNILEQKLASQLKQIADRTRIDQEELRERLDHGDDQYLAGELATAGTLECLQCGERLLLKKTEKLDNCQKCSGRFYKRVSEQWQP